MQKTKKAYAKVKSFISDHEDAFWLGTVATFYAGVIAASGVVLYKAVEQQKKEQDWIQNQNYDGKAVFRLADGGLIAVPEGSTQFA